MPSSPSGPGLTDTHQRHLERRGLARGGALSFLGSTGSAALGFLIVLAAARLMGEAEAGVLIQVIGLFSIVTVLAKVGLDSAALWLLPRLMEQDPRSVGRHVTYVLTVAGLAGATAGIVTGALLPRLLALNEAQRGVAEATSALAWFVPAGVLVLVSMGVTRALGALVPYVVWGNLALPALRLAAVVVAASIGATSMLVTIAWAVPLVPILSVLLLVTLLRVNRLRRTVAPIPSASERAAAPGWPSRSERRRVLGFALPRTASAGLEQLLVWLDVLIVGALLGPAAAALYGSATRFIAAGLVVDTALRVVISPRFSLLMHRQDIPGTQDLYRTATRWLVLFATPGFVLLVIFAPVLLSWLGPGFADAETALVVLAVGAMVTFLAGNIHSILLMSGHPGWAASNKAAAVLVSVVGCLTLVPWLGLTGAALAWSAAMLVDAAAAAVEVYRLVGVSPEIGVGLFSLALSVLSVGAPAALARATLGPTNLALLVGAAGGSALFLLTMYLLRERLQLSGLRGAA